MTTHSLNVGCELCGSCRLCVSMATTRADRWCRHALSCTFSISSFRGFWLPYAYSLCYYTRSCYTGELSDTVNTEVILRAKRWFGDCEMEPVNLQILYLWLLASIGRTGGWRFQKQWQCHKQNKDYEWTGSVLCVVQDRKCSCNNNAMDYCCNGLQQLLVEGLQRGRRIVADSIDICIFL